MRAVILATYLAVRLFLKNRQARGLSKQTIRWYKGILEKFAKAFPNLPERPEQIDTFLLAQKVGDERLHGYWRALRAFYRFLYKRYRIPDVIELTEPPKRRPKEPRPLTPDELSQLLLYPHSEKVRTALLFLADTGARVGELTNLQITDISESPWGYIVRLTGKTGTRLIPISPEVYDALMKSLPFGYSAFRLRRIISQAFKDAKIDGAAHRLRHTFGTLWDGEELVLQRIMGHSSLATTKIYRKLKTKKLSEQHRKYSPLRIILNDAKAIKPCYTNNRHGDFEGFKD